MLSLLLLIAAADKPLAFEGIKLVPDARLGAKHLAKKGAACKLEDPGDMPDGVSPAFVILAFASDAQAFEALAGDIRCRVPEWNVANLQIMSASEYATVLPEAGVRLKELAAAKASDKTIPIVPFLNAAAVFQAKKHAVGSGLLFVTQFAQDDDSVDPKSLFAVYQAVVKDRFVLGFFPLAYQKPLPKLDPKGKVESYMTEVARVLDAAKPSEFSPPLDAIESTISSLKLP